MHLFGETVAMNRLAFAIVFILCISAAIAQDSTSTKAYGLDDAYEVYSAVLADEISSGFATGTLVIQQNTVSKPGISACLTDEATKRFADAEADFWHANRRDWILLRRFEINKPYDLLSEGTIRAAFKSDGDWDGFYKRHPGSGGYIVLSAVGFNRDKTQAVVYTGRHCGSLCGHWSFHLLEKAGGRWKQVDGVNCSAVS